MELGIIISLIVFGVVLLLIEMFLIPGISVAGIAGLFSFAAAVVYAFKISQLAGIISLAISLILSVVAIIVFLKSNLLDKMSLSTQIDSKYEVADKKQFNVGDEGVTITRLAPIGRIKVNGFIIEAKVESAFLDEGTPIVVVELLNTSVVVKEK